MEGISSLATYKVLEKERQTLDPSRAPSLLALLHAAALRAAAAARTPATAGKEVLSALWLEGGLPAWGGAEALGSGNGNGTGHGVADAGDVRLFRFTDRVHERSAAAVAALREAPWRKGLGEIGRAHV